LDREQPKKRGGLRSPPGGRPRGSKNVLGLGEVKALKAAGLRVPKDAPEGHRELADEALQRIVDVMRGDVSYLEAGSVLKASTHLRSEICGEVTKKVEASGPDGGPLEIIVKTVAE
jgi:hypothetical protein